MRCKNHEVPVEVPDLFSHQSTAKEITNAEEQFKQLFDEFNGNDVDFLAIPEARLRNEAIRLGFCQVCIDDLVESWRVESLPATESSGHDDLMIGPEDLQDSFWEV